MLKLATVGLYVQMHVLQEGVVCEHHLHAGRKCHQNLHGFYVFKSFTRGHGALKFGTYIEDYL
jgi:hypothetical protein